MAEPVSAERAWYQNFWTGVVALAFCCWLVTSFQLLTIRLALSQPPAPPCVAGVSFASAMVQPERPWRSLAPAASLSPVRPRVAWPTAQPESSDRLR